MAKLIIRFNDGSEKVIDDAICVEWDEDGKLWVEMESDYEDVSKGEVTFARGHWVSGVTGYSVEGI